MTKKVIGFENTRIFHMRYIQVTSYQERNTYYSSLQFLSKGLKLERCSYNEINDSVATHVISLQNFTFPISALRKCDCSTSFYSAVIEFRRISKRLYLPLSIFCYICQ